MKTVRICYFDTWADRLEAAASYLERLPNLNLAGRIANPADVALLRKARLDCEWYGENLRCFTALNAAECSFLPAYVTGAAGLLDWIKLPRQPGEERWLIFMAHQPQALGPVGPKVFALMRQAGIRILFYAFDEASRFMPCFREIAPFLDVLIHDESPLDPAGEAALRPDCLRIHRSWVANFVPFSVPFNESPEQKILFLGSQLGLTDHRRRQIEFLQRRFKDRFVPSTDHSVSVTKRAELNRFKVGLCPEGRKFTTPAMSRTHTDRPFWCGCLGLVPVSENSVQGNRLNELTEQNLILRYPHADLEKLAERCERALEMPNEQRRRIYDHFNRHETVGTVIANAIASARPVPVFDVP